MSNVTPETLKDAQQYVDFVKTNLEPLAQHLKVSVQWLWDILVQQARVEAIVYLVIAVLLTIKSVIFLMIAYKNWKKARFGNSYSRDKVAYINKKTGVEVDWDTWYDHKNLYDTVEVSNKTNKEGYIAAWSGIAGAALAIAATVTLVVTLPVIVTGLINPEYRAIEKIVEFAKPIAKETKVQ